MELNEKNLAILTPAQLTAIKAIAQALAASNVKK